jgi:circadian clock protein KaiB
MTAPHDARANLADELTAPDETCYELTLFVSGASDLSARAIADARLLCDVRLDGPYRLSVVDVHEERAAVLSNRVLAAPTLVKNRPLPVRKVVGDLSHADKVLVALGLPVAGDVPNGQS